MSEERNGQIDKSSIKLEDMSNEYKGGVPRKTNFDDLKDKFVEDSSEFKRPSNAKSTAKTKTYSNYYSVDVKGVLLKILAGLLVLLVIYIIMYFSIAAGRRDVEEKISKVLLAPNTSTQTDLSNSTAGDGISDADKIELGISYFLIDSDKDGLSDAYEINVSKTDPSKSDSDVDAIPDGLELMLGLDPLSKMSDGITEDNALIVEKTFTAGNATLNVNNKATSMNIYFDVLNNNSIKGQLGVIGEVYEVYSDSAISGTTLSFNLTGDDIRAADIAPESIAIVRFDNDTHKFIPLETNINTEDNTISAEITENGVYSLSNSNIIGKDYATQILFLIDNSGSMYPEELCKGSERE